jgi:lysosomal acid lipase/cholesteryl ester hydrolase
MGNARGNAYSKKHTFLEPNSKEYWDFRYHKLIIYFFLNLTTTVLFSYSWNEIGYYDLPAMIDYILALTNQQQLYFVGHSQGTTSLFVLLSTRPEYNQKISTAFLLSPVAFLKNVPNPIFRLLGLNYGQLEVFVTRLTLEHLFL